MSLRHLTIFVFVLSGFLAGCGRAARLFPTREKDTVTHLEITDKIELAKVTRFGINLGDQSYYDAGMMRKDLLFRNPGFEGMTYTSIVRCRMQGTKCDDGNPYSDWPTGFWNDAHYETIAGETVGSQGVVLSMIASDKAHNGAQLELSGTAVHEADSVALHKYFPGDPTAGWWPEQQQGGHLEAEFTDLPPGTRGKQSLHMTATQPGSTARVLSYFDTFPKRSFLHMNGTFRLSFRAKALGGGRSLNVELGRFLPQWRSYSKQQIKLAETWKEYTVPFSIHEAVGTQGSVRLSLDAAGSDLLLDDVSLQQTDTDPANQTVLRDDVVRTLKELHPGTLRFMSSNGALGSMLDNQLLPAEARSRPGYSAWSSRTEDVPLGLNEFLDLCQAVHSDPWIVVPTATTAAQATRWIETLSARKDQFHRIYLELGNEAWNGSFTAETLEDPLQYAQHVTDVFSAMRSVPEFDPKRFELVLNGQAVAIDRTREIVRSARFYDTVALAPYFANQLNTPANDAQMYRDLLGEPEAIVRDGFLSKQAAMLQRAAPDKSLAFYEVNLSTTTGTADQATLDRYTPSLAAGLSVANMMLLAQSQLHVRSQQFFVLAQYAFQRGDKTQVKLWGSVLDMGLTNLHRPQFLALQLANRAIGGDLLKINQSGEMPTWDRPASDGLPKANDLQEITSFAYRDGHITRLLVLNLSVTTAHVIDFSGANAPRGDVHTTRLTADSAGATNEESVHVETHDLGDSPAHRITLPPNSMTLFTWKR